MGGGSWTSRAFDDYITTSYGMDSDTYSTSSMSARQIYRARGLNEKLNPYNVMRECCDSEEHPNTLPVILALDVTGSMGQAAVKTAQQLNEIMTSLYEDESVKDIEFCVMGIGDLYCDNSPIQISQFESDIRIAEQMSDVYFEFGGGGNTWESYSAAWYMGLNHCKLDCWDRGQKGIIITLGDELPNPYLDYTELNAVTGDKLTKDISTVKLLNATREKYDVYHVSVDDENSSYEWHNRSHKLDDKWRQLLGNNYKVANLNNLAEVITNIIKNKASDSKITW